MHVIPDEQMLSSKDQTLRGDSTGISLPGRMNEEDDGIQAGEGDGEGHGQVRSTTPVEKGAETRTDDDYDGYLSGWRLQVLNLAMCLNLFLSSLESTIVSTSLVSISNSLHSFNISSWIVTSYLLTYTGFLIIIAKLSDIFGRKLFMIGVLIVFVAFSIGCGLSQNMTTLIVLRAFQGIGGGGLYALSFVILPEMVPMKNYPFYAALLSSMSALSNLAGPLFGGIINHNEDSNNLWRWIFLLNAPAGAVSLILILVGMPSNFPFHKKTKKSPRKWTLKNFRRIDIIGAVLLLAASVLLVTALEQGGTQFSWQNAVPISLLALAFVLSLAFLGWEWYQEKRDSLQEPVLPWHLATDRFAMGLFLNSFFSGAALLCVVIILPQRFQVVNGNSPLQAGYRLLALTVVFPVGAFVAGILTQRLKLPHLWVLIGSAPLQIIGLALLGTLNSKFPIQAATYGYEVILGLGFGVTLGTCIMMIPLVVSKRDMAVGMGGVGQFRFLGGAISIGIATTVLNNHLTSSLSGVLSPLQLKALQHSVQVLDDLPPGLQTYTRHVFAEGYNKIMNIMIAFATGGLLSSFLVWERVPRRMA